MFLLLQLLGVGLTASLALYMGYVLFLIPVVKTIRGQALAISIWDVLLFGLFVVLTVFQLLVYTWS